MEINLQESADWFKLTNEIPNVWGNIYFVKGVSLYQIYMVHDNLVSGHFASLISHEVQTTHLFRHAISEKKDALDTRLVS